VRYIGTLLPQVMWRTSMPSSISASAIAGSVKLGHPVPESNFASELNSSFPHAAQE